MVDEEQPVEGLRQEGCGAEFEGMADGFGVVMACYDEDRQVGVAVADADMLDHVEAGDISHG